ncbi:MAG: helix-turn-helix domain-containing protein [Oscillospiraceae bacterium]|nr:helix-turn-helix domain-containing protein [Oscillospiraceae bacterium]
MPVSEYVRRRRMSEAARELRESDIKIIDLALKYGYDSPDAFSRAYQNFHGVSPSITRKFNMCKKYDRILIQVKIRHNEIKFAKNERRIRMKKTIESVCEIGWGQTSANPYIGAVTACMDALGEGNDYTLASVISGLGFTFNWYPYTNAPNDANITDDAMIRRTFDALGCKVSIYRDRDTQKSPPSHPKEFYKEKIVSSIDNGFPVMGFGFTEDYPYACVIVGYEDNGDRLYFRSYWDHAVKIDEQTGYQYSDDWYKRCYGIAVIDEKVAPMINGKELLKYCMKNAVEVASQTSSQFYDITQPYGFAAYDAMIGVLEDDDFWKDKDDEFYKRMDSSYCHLGLLLRDNYKWLAAMWLEKNADDSKAGRQIKKGLEYYDMLGWLVTETIRFKPDFNDCKLVMNPCELAKHEVRESRIPLIKIAKRLDQLAVECFKNALELL